eukprot:5985438-Prymnesium_polylepis.1
MAVARVLTPVCRAAVPRARGAGLQIHHCRASCTAPRTCTGRCPSFVAVRCACSQALVASAAERRSLRV